MKILISGNTGLIGAALCELLTANNHQVVGLSRRAPAENRIQWNPSAEKLDAGQLEGFDAVVHLAGEGIAAGRWSVKQKARIRESRVVGTNLLCQTLATLKRPPRVLVSASAIGYYGNRNDELLVEESLPGDGFLSDVCSDWEAAAQPALESGIRVVHPRFGVVLSQNGGALAKMLTPFTLGLGGIVGNGRQYWSWIALDDVVGGIAHAITHETLTGPINFTAPHPETNRAFTKALGKVLRRPTFFPLPAFAARLMLGQMADELLLASSRVSSKKLQDAGYEFQYPQLEPALRHVLDR